MKPQTSRYLLAIALGAGFTALVIAVGMLLKSGNENRVQNTVPAQNTVQNQIVATTTQREASHFVATSTITGAPFESSFELVTGTFTFKVTCDGKLYDEKVSCSAPKKLVVIRDERPTGGTLVEEKVLATATTTEADDVISFKTTIVPGAGEGTSIVIDFHVENLGGLGVCMSDRYNGVYDTVSPGKYTKLKNYPDYAMDGVWANGVLAYVPGCSSGAGYPSDSVMIYNPSKDKVITVTETKAVPPGMWDDLTGFPFDVTNTKLPYWSDLKWNDRLGNFTINLHLVDGKRIRPYAFDTAGKEVTAEGL